MKMNFVLFATCLTANLLIQAASNAFRNEATLLNQSDIVVGLITSIVVVAVFRFYTKPKSA